MKIGADPELFLVDAANAASLVSSIGLIGGSKWAPRPLPELGDGYAVQEDNVALEYNIPAASSANELASNIGTIMAHLRQSVGQMGLAFSNESAVYFPKHFLNCPEALEFGCEPDYNAWTNDVNPHPKALDETLRSCGGHVHVGDFDGDVLKAVKMMDLMLAVPSIVMDEGQLRKQLYGKAGAFRPKPYGFEYRVLSNFWVLGNDALVKWVWQNTQLALDSMHIDVDAIKPQIYEAINNNNEHMARQLIQQYNIPTL
jgi:hypothetical protein